MDTLQNIDSDGNINAAYYENAIRELIPRYADMLNYDINKLTSNNLLAISNHIYKTLFKPQTTIKNNQKCNIPYNEYNFKTLLDIYSHIALDYNALPSLYTFSCLTGIQEETLRDYVTDAGQVMVKSRKEYLINRLNENNIGVMTLANNEQSIGLMYNRQNIIDHATVKQSLNVNDLVKLPQNE